MVTFRNIKFIRKLGEKIKPYLPFFEVFTLLMVGANYFVEQQVFNTVVLLLLTTLAILYFFIGNVIPKTNIIEVFIYKTFFGGMSVSLIGFVFVMMNYPGANMMLFLGGISILGTLFVKIVMMIFKKEDKLKKKELTVREAEMKLLEEKEKKDETGNYIRGVLVLAFVIYFYIIA